MRSSFWSHLLVAIISAVIVITIFSFKPQKEPMPVSACALYQANSKETSLFKAEQNPGDYKVRNFDFTKINGISQSQLSQHHKLYQGYINKFNEIESELKKVDHSKGSTTYSQLRALKVPETFALNGVILHELYFSNLGSNTQMGPQMKEIIERNFGSVEKFKEDLFGSASSARGWILTGYNIYDGSVRNYLLDAHNETVPVLTLPILMVDTYEHAYMIDFGIDRAKYLEILWNNINWDAVEKRIEQWVNKFRTYIHD